MIVLALTVLYAALGKLPLVEALFYGVKAAVLAIVIEALLRVARRALKTRADWAIAALAFVALFFFAVPFPAVIIAAALAALVVIAFFSFRKRRIRMLDQDPEALFENREILLGPAATASPTPSISAT